MYTGKLVKLREYRREDIPLAQQYVNDPDIKTCTTPGVPWPFTLEDEQRWFESISAANETYNFAIELLTDGQYLGGCGINEIDRKNSHVTIGIFIGNKAYQRKGYGTDAMNILTAFIFNQMNIHKIKLEVYDFNTHAVRCYEKCGFKKEGELRAEVFKNGAYHNTYIMGLLREEWQKKIQQENVW